MSVTISEYPTETDTMRSFNEKTHHHPEHRKGLLEDNRSSTHEKLRHTAKGLEAMGFNRNASMYHHEYDEGYRQYSIDSQESAPKESKKEKRRMSFVKKLISGGGKEKGEKQ